jgi:PD-(D/E)XK nuclease superfamily
VTLSEKHLADLFVANDEFDELERALDVFCPFEASGMVKQEVRHGYFLCYIFDPQRPHGFGSSCIRALMAAAAKSSNDSASGLGLLDIHLMDFDSAIVRREWRKIDILIEVPGHKLIVAIELKIDAHEHSGQLSRYRQKVEEEWPTHKHLFLFLTKRGDEPSDSDGANWQSVNLDALSRELGLLTAGTVGVNDARTMLRAYLAMLGRHHLSDERLEQLAERLWAQHKEALDFLADRRPDAFGDVFQLLSARRNEIAEQLTQKCEVNVSVDHSTRAYIRLAVTGWDEIPDYLCAEGFTPSRRLILIEIVKASSSDDALRCYFQLGKGDPEMRERLFFQLKERGADVGKKDKPTKEWNRLASVTFSKVSGQDGQDGQDASEIALQVETKIIGFLSKHIPIYDKALNELKAG